MQRAIDLAYLGAGTVSPNPMVGAVIVHNDRIIAEGYHRQSGGPHAEIDALNNVKDRSLLPDSTLYVTLEPCSHHGKTPPCAVAVIESGIRRVVTGITDPNPLVSGSGIRMLRQHGIEVTENTLTHECRELNKRFLTYITHKTPYVILKWAQTANGFISPDLERLGPEAFEKQRHITGFVAQQLTHRWRTEEDAVMVGTNTVTTDNPRLNARAWNGRPPVRVVLDLNNRLPEDRHVFDDSQRTIIFNSHRSLRHASASQTLCVGIDETGNIPEQVCEALHAQQIQSLVVEGGAQLLRTFIDAGLWHEAQVLTSPKRFAQGVKAPGIGGNLVAETLLDGNHITLIKP